jgi:hypothetical protein
MSWGNVQWKLRLLVQAMLGSPMRFY